MTCVYWKLQSQQLLGVFWLLTSKSYLVEGKHRLSDVKIDWSIKKEDCRSQSVSIASAIICRIQYQWLKLENNLIKNKFAAEYSSTCPIDMSFLRLWGEPDMEITRILNRIQSSDCVCTTRQASHSMALFTIPHVRYIGLT